MRLIPSVQVMTHNNTLDCVFIHPVTMKPIETYSVAASQDMAILIGIRQLEIALELSDEVDSGIEDDILAFKWILTQPRQVKNEFRRIRASGGASLPIRKVVMMIRGRDKK